MKKFLPLVALCLIGWGLFESKPVAKGRYVAQVTHDFQFLCCSAPSISDPNCRRLRPLVRPVVQGTLIFYTDAPRDYVFFTRYTTLLPRQTIHGVGVAGHVIIWVDSSRDGEFCDILYNVFLADPFVGQ